MKFKLTFNQKCSFINLVLPTSLLFRIRGLCLMKCPSKILQNLPYFYHKKIPVVFVFIFLSSNFIFPPNECPRLCQYRPGHSLGGKKLREMKNKKETTWVFL